MALPRTGKDAELETWSDMVLGGLRRAVLCPRTLIFLLISERYRKTYVKYGGDNRRLRCFYLRS